MSDIMRFSSISDLQGTLGLDGVKHPLLAVVDLSKSYVPEAMINQRIAIDLYSISIKTKSKTLFQYGRKHYDFSKGSLIAIEPGQVISIDQAYEKGDIEGIALYFHPDLLAGSALQQLIKSYGFFSYDLHEALHLSDDEDLALRDIFSKIEKELNQNIDDFSLDIQVANIDLLLKYINRYFNRQFITRKHKNVEIVTKLNQQLDDYFSSELAMSEGLPSVKLLAEKINLSPNYMSDLLKKETGMNTQDLIHQHVIERSKYSLLNSNRSIAQISYQLGFEYPQYFSRLFKKKTGMTPAQYRESSPHH